MSKNVQKIVKKMSKSYQKVIKKFSKSFQKSFQKSCQKINKECFNQRPHFISGRRKIIERRRRIAFARPGADNVAPGKNMFKKNTSSFVLKNLSGDRSSILQGDCITQNYSVGGINFFLWVK
jgi:hypothetical protein